MNNDYKKIINLEQLKVIYLLANTPMFLLDRFVKESSVQELVAKYNAKELIKEFSQIYKKMDQDFDFLIYLYTFLSAISLKNYFEIEGFLYRLDNYNFEWRSELKSIILSKAKNTSQSIIDLKFKPAYSMSLNSEKSSSSYILKKTTPKINIIEDK
jgi:hypothetical protein